DLVDLGSGPGLDQLVDRPAKRARVAEQRGDVAEHDPGLGIIRNGADRCLEIVLELGADHAALIENGLQAAPLWRTMGPRATGDGACRWWTDRRRRGRPSCRSSAEGLPACPARSGCTITGCVLSSSSRRMHSAAWRGAVPTPILGCSDGLTKPRVRTRSPSPT